MNYANDHIRNLSGVNVPENQTAEALLFTAMSTHRLPCGDGTP
ncbi:MAG: hypothetical protein ACLR7U_10135 [Ruthenibacterium lactatiformans]